MDAGIRIGSETMLIICTCIDKKHHVILCGMSIAYTEQKKKSNLNVFHG